MHFRGKDERRGVGWTPDRASFWPWLCTWGDPRVLGIQSSVWKWEEYRQLVVLTPVQGPEGTYLRRGETIQSMRDTS